MGYQMFTGPRLETLVQAHLDQFDAGFFGPRPVVVLQNQSLSQWLKLFLAQARGGYATGDFVFQDELLRRLIADRSPERVLFIDDLKWALYRHMARSADQPALAPLLRGSRDPARLFELADHLAGVFHGYAMNSRLWPAALSSGILPHGTGADEETFGWQSALWRGLLDGQTLAGLVLERLTRQPPEVSGPPARVVIVGSAFLSRRAAAFLSAWAGRGLIDVVHLLLAPSVLPAHDWPASRPWSSWGAFGKAFLEALPAPTSASVPEGTTALARLQTGLASGTAFKGSPDGTVEVVSCPHPLRELEALRDRLLAALHDDPTLEVSDIAVLAPDINVYAPFLDAAFASDNPGRHLRFHVIDLDLGRENPWFRALNALLDLVSEVDRPSLFALIDSRPFREAWQVDDEERELWLDYTDTVSAWREDGPGAPQSWSASWDRLFEGWFRTDEGDLPRLDVAPSFRELARLHDLVQRLLTLGSDARRSRGFLEWVRFLDTAAADFLTDDDAGTALSGRLRTLVEDGGDFDLPWSGFRAFVQDQIAHFPGRRGQLLTEGVHCSSLRPLRAIPFRIIAVVGLDEGAFPRSDPAPSFDLSRFEEGRDALSVPALDRYCFWETVMAARDRLYLSYRGTGAAGQPRPPSPVLADLLDFLETDAPWPTETISVNDFSAAGGTTWSTRTFRRALAVRGNADLPRDEPRRPARPEPFLEVTSAEVVQAFVTPARFHLRRVRQIVLIEEDRRGVEDEEPWSLPFLDRHAWLAEGAARELEDAPDWDADALVRREVALGRAREGAFADRDRRELGRRARQVSDWARSLRRDGWRPAQAATRTVWAGAPWSGTAEGLERGTEFLLPLLLYGKELPARTRFAAALAVLQKRPGGAARLSALNPAGERRELSWNPAVAVEPLTQSAELYWNEAVLRPQPFYPDLLERVARRRADGSSWEESLRTAWEEALDTRFGTSESTFGRDPYARLAFAEGPPAETIRDLERWWDDLFGPLLEAWV